VYAAKVVLDFGWCAVWRYGPEPTASPLMASSQAPGLEKTCFGMILARVRRETSGSSDAEAAALGAAAGAVKETHTNGGAAGGRTDGGPRQRELTLLMGVPRTPWRGRAACGRPAQAAAVSCAAIDAPSSHTFSREILPSLNSKTCSMRKVIRRLLPGMPRKAPVTTAVMRSSTVAASSE
jgi:hypothetical protein